MQYDAYDIVIVGGGMVGASLACALRSTDFTIALVDASSLVQNEDPRLIALNYSSYCLFKHLAIWESLAPYAAAIDQVHVSHRGRFGITRLTAIDANLPTLGYVVPAKYINAGLYNCLAHQKNITLIRPATLNNLEQHPDKVILSVATTEGEKNIVGKIIIGADGSHSTVRHLMGISTQTIDCQQSALVTTTTLQRSHRHIAYERFLEKGAIAMLPLPDEHVATIWTDDCEKITALQQQSDEEFLQTLQQQFGYRLGKLKKIGNRFTFPLQWIYAEKSIKNRTILLGNALHTLHPIAATGLNLALFEIAELASYLSTLTTIDESLSLETENIFSTLQQKRSQKLSETLSWLFSTDFFFLNKARQIGMVSLDSCSRLKKYFTQRAIGQTGKVPLLLGEREV